MFPSFHSEQGHVAVAAFSRVATLSPSRVPQRKRNRSVVMKTASAILAVLSWTAIATATPAVTLAAGGLTFSATAIHAGKQVDVSGLEFLPIPFMRSHHHRNSTWRSHSSPPRRPGSTGGSGTDKRATPAVSYSDNWCGVSQHTTASDPITGVYGVFASPDLTIRPSQSMPQFAAAWVGIDGASCQTSLLQAGTSTVVNTNGGQSASAWWQWVPNASYSISGFPVKPGDWIGVNITASSPTNGKIIITNYDRDYSLTLVLNNGPKLCRQDADWIIEDFDDDSGEPTPFPRFSDTWFEDCAATTASGRKIGIDGAAMIYLGHDSQSAICKAESYDNENFYCYSQG